MAKQGSIIKLEGTIGDVTFYKSRDGYMAREKGGVSADRIKNDAAFERTRENGAEFGRAGAAGRLLRTAFRLLLQNGADARMVSRLTKEMMAVIKADASSNRGLRNVLDGELGLLQGFDFNLDASLSATVFMPYTATIDRVTGALKVAIPAFSPSSMVNAPEGATHLRFVSGGASIDFVNDVYESETSKSVDVDLALDQVAAIELLNQLKADSTHPLFLLLGVEFFQKVNEANYSLKSGKFNALSIVGVSGM